MDFVVRQQKQLSGRSIVREKDFDAERRVVRVVPKNDLIRKYLKHGVTKVGFLAEGSAEWPNDSFTKRRVKDGDVTIEEAASNEENNKAQAPKSARRLPAPESEKA